VLSRASKHVYARKRIHRQKDLNKDKEVIEKFENELQILKRLDHVHLVKVFGSYTDLRYVAILMKPVAEMDLKQFLRTRGHLLHGSERSLFRSRYGCLASALAYLHENKIRHKDIKPSNILLKRDDIYITDFGTAIEFDEDQSMTKGTVRAKTTQYQSPEVSRGAKRGTASDIWSLGVTFLEMTTVLRGETLDSMKKFLANNGSNDEYVFENIQGAIKWTEHLRKKADLPRVDNSPLQWIKDMLEEKAADRPTAQKLCHDIKQVEDGGGTAFCGKCCHADGSTASDVSSDADGDDEDTVRPVDTTVKTKLTPPKRDRTSPTQRKQSSKKTVKSDPLKSNQHPRKSALHKQVMSSVLAYLPNISMANLSLYPTTRTANPDVEILREPIASALEQSEDQDPYECIMPGSFPGNYPTVTSFARNPPVTIHQEHSPATPQHGGDKQIPYSRTLEPPQVFRYTLKPEIASGLASSTVVEDDASLEGTLGKEAPRRARDLTQVDEDSLFHTNNSEPAATLQSSPRTPSVTLEAFLKQPTTRILRVRSDENLDIQRQTKALLANVEDGSDGIAITSLRKRRFSDTYGAGGARKGSMTSLDVEPESFTQQLHNSPVIIHQASGENPAQAIPEETFVPASGCTEEHIPESNAAQTSTQGSNLNLPSESAPKSSRPPPIVTSSRVSPQSQSMPNALLAWLANSRAPPATSRTSGPTRLTGQNLAAHNDRKPPLRTSPPRFKIERASVYMKKVFDDTASSVATSLMSERTRESFKQHGLMLPLQDRSCNYLGHYTKIGKVDAVRLLLRAGCNPGTKKHPRTGPIFDVVKGASSRHTKCLRELIEYGVDVNARRNGKTPLHLAVDQEPWSGYVTVIYLLLAAGANPNSKNDSGDVPLLRLLGGGFLPLEDHHRKALALLLSPSYKTKVTVTPLGTQNKPLHLAIRRKDPWVVGMLLEKDHSVIESENSEGLTPLLLAARLWSPPMTSDQLEILDLLLEKRANVNVKMDLTNKTPLHIAISHGLIDAIERLLEHGADVNSQASDGKTAKDFLDDRRKEHGCLDCSDCAEIEDLLEKFS
jgi:serine/threonine protein kinase/ankyrin repeat protein